jgi:hypothetical protein
MGDSGSSKGVRRIDLASDAKDRNVCADGEAWPTEGRRHQLDVRTRAGVGPHCATHEQFTIPQVPIRRRLTGLSEFVVNRGGEYFFMPGLRALRWIAELKS